MEKRKTLKPIHPSAPIQIAYQKKIDALVDEMNKSITKWIIAAYRANQPEMAQDIGIEIDQTTSQEIAKAIRQDGSPERVLQSVIKKLKKKWQKKFDEAAPNLATYFATAVKDRVDSNLKKILKDGGFTVQFKMTAKLNDVLQATTMENVSLIKSIPSQYFSEIEGMVMRSVSAGRDLGTLSKDLQSRFGITKRRAALISRDQNNKATATITRTRQDECGIVEAKWRHSGAGKHPRHEHVEFNGKFYNIKEGMWSKEEGKFIFPGELINCRCVSVAVLPSLGRR